MESKQNIIICNDNVYSLIGLIDVSINKRYNSYKEIYDGYYIELEYSTTKKYISFHKTNFSNDLEKTRIECTKLYNKIKRNMK